MTTWRANGAATRASDVAAIIFVCMLPGALRVQSISGGFFSRDCNFTVDPAAMAARGVRNTPADPSNAFESHKRVPRYQPAAMQVFPRRGTTVPSQSERVDSGSVCGRVHGATVLHTV